MKQFMAELQSSTPLSFGRNHGTPKLPRELDQAYEERTVLQKLHTAVGQIFIPPMAFKLCLEQTASYLGEQIPGKGAERYTKHYRQGIICPDPIMLGLTAEDVRIDKVFIPSQPGRPKSGRVWKWFPVIDQWVGTLQIIAIDDIFTQDVLLRHLKIGGQLTGIGVWRAGNGGLNGKFKVLSLSEEAIIAD